MIRIFIYGTLKSGEVNHRVLEHANAVYIQVGKTTLKIFSMVQGMYPELYKNGDEHVTGEVWSVPEDSIYILDAFEGHPVLYKRDLILIDIDGETIECQTYFKEVEDGNV